VSIQLREAMMSVLGQLRYEPIASRRTGPSRTTPGTANRSCPITPSVRCSPTQLSGYVALDFAAFDVWYEEDEVNVGHPRDPFHRIDVLAGTRPLPLELDGKVLAESTRPMMLFEAMLPTRYYLPLEDVLAQLEPSEKRSYCAYKGEGSYLTLSIGARMIPDLGWSDAQPVYDAARVRGHIALLDERLDVVLDGERVERPGTRWSSLG